MLLFDFSVQQDLPCLLYFKAAIEILIYQTFDAADGNQARRTKSSSPLG